MSNTSNPRLTVGMRGPGGLWVLRFRPSATRTYAPSSQAISLSVRVTGPSPSVTVTDWTFALGPAGRLVATYSPVGTEIRSPGWHHFSGALTVAGSVYDLHSFELYAGAL